MIELLVTELIFAFCVKQNSVLLMEHNTPANLNTLSEDSSYFRVDPRIQSPPELNLSRSFNKGRCVLNQPTVLRCSPLILDDVHSLATDHFNYLIN